MKKLLLFMLSLIVSVGASAEKLQMDLSNLGAGWSSDYSNKTITFTGAWGARGWSFTNNGFLDAGKYLTFILEIEATDQKINLQILYNTMKSNSDVYEEEWIDIDAGTTRCEVNLREAMKSEIREIMIKSEKQCTVVLKEAYLYREGPEFDHVTIEYESNIRKEWLVPYYNMDNNATAEVVVNHAAGINGWGIGRMHSWDSNVQDIDISANSNETSSTFVYNLSELIAFAGESDGFEFSFWEKKDVTPTIASITLSLNKITIPITDAGIGSMILPFDADVPEGMTVYEVDSYEEGTLRLKSVESIVANTPYIIKGKAKDYPFVGVAEAENFQYNDNAGNLRGTYEDITAPQDSYVLQKHEGEDAGFYRVNETQPTVRAYRAYLTGLPVGGSSCLRLVFDDETTDVLSVSAATPATYASYNLAGQRAHKGQKGIVIANGKKYIAK